MERRLEGLFKRMATARPNAVALIDPLDSLVLTYSELDRFAERIAAELVEVGVQAGDRVGICIPKSTASVAAVLGALKAGAAYVPADPTGPVTRAADIFDDCGVAAVLCEKGLAGAMLERSGRQLRVACESASGEAGSTEVVLIVPQGISLEPPPVEGLAYILYTSGTTGRPKGVMHTHDSALAFVDWCIEMFEPRPTDCFSSHAPFHFDLSIHDLWVSLTTGARVVLIGETAGKQPLTLTELISDYGITIWYSTPSILRMIVEFGRVDPARYRALRIVHFAGEVFPVKHLRALKELWQTPRYFNLYGPTETNVCTFLEIPGIIPPELDKPFPIGRPCSGDRCRVVDEHGRDVPEREAGELLVAGPSVMVGYWSVPEQEAKIFLIDEAGERWYRTGDIVEDLGGGCYAFLGRRDRMVKRRGYRVELGEIEAALYRHPGVSEAAVLAIPDERLGLRIRAYVAWGGEERPSFVLMKQFCAWELPLYMVPDDFLFVSDLPKTSTDKIDYRMLETSSP